MKVLVRKFDEIRIKTDFKKVVWIYDTWGWLTESKAVKKVLKLANIKNGVTILDVACGTGKLFNKVVIILMR